MEILQDFKSVPRPTVGSLKGGDVFLIEVKVLHDSERVAYVVCSRSCDEALAKDVRVVRLSDGYVETMKEWRAVTPVKAVLTVEVPFG